MGYVGWSSRRCFGLLVFSQCLGHGVALPVDGGYLAMWVGSICALFWSNMFRLTAENMTSVMMRISWLYCIRSMGLLLLPQRHFFSNVERPRLSLLYVVRLSLERYQSLHILFVRRDVLTSLARLSGVCLASHHSLPNSLYQLIVAANPTPKSVCCVQPKSLIFLSSISYSVSLNGRSLTQSIWQWRLLVVSWPSRVSISIAISMFSNSWHELMLYVDPVAPLCKIVSKASAASAPYR